MEFGILEFGILEFGILDFANFGVLNFGLWNILEFGILDFGIWSWVLFESDCESGFFGRQPDAPKSQHPRKHTHTHTSKHAHKEPPLIFHTGAGICTFGKHSQTIRRIPRCEQFWAGYL